MTPPTPAAIKAARQKLGLSVREFEEAIGYSTDGRITQALEAGVRNGRPFEMAGPAQAALGYLVAIKAAYDEMQADRGGFALLALAESLPERLR
jgi:transcriptional regulator with XRE-family HTH domain